MVTAIRVIGIVLVLLGTVNLAGMFILDLSTLTSPLAVAIRYILMIVAGVGFFLTRRWAISVYLVSLVINWVVFFTIYEGQSLAPIWLSMPIPIVILGLTYFAWDKLKPGFIGETRGDA